MSNLLITVILPVLILMQLSDEDRLGPDRALILALALPLGWAAMELVRKRKVSANPIIGAVGVLLTGGFRLFDIPPEWFAVKEASIPAALAIAILVSAWIGKPLARIFLNSILDRDRIDVALHENGTFEEYERRTSIATYLLASAFILSAILNFVLARVIVTADAGTEQFNDQLGRMTALSYPVITIPVMIVLMGTLWYVFSMVGKLTGLPIEEMMKQKPKGTRDAEPAPATSQEPGNHVVGK